MLWCGGFDKNFTVKLAWFIESLTCVNNWYHLPHNEKKETKSVRRNTFTSADCQATSCSTGKAPRSFSEISPNTLREFLCLLLEIHTGVPYFICCKHALRDMDASSRQQHTHFSPHIDRHRNIFTLYTPTCWCSTAVRYACCSICRNLRRRECNPAARFYCFSLPAVSMSRCTFPTQPCYRQTVVAPFE